MITNFIICMIVLLVVIYLHGFTDKKERFINSNTKTNLYETVGLVPTKILHLNPPNPTELDVDYQDDLNEISGYDSATRGYNNPLYALNVAANLDTN